MGCKTQSRPKARRSRRSGKSPYARHGKTPHVYSAEYQQWRAGILGKKKEKKSG